MKTRVVVLAALLALLPVFVAADPVPGVPWTCSLDNLGATLTLCQGHVAPGLKLYVTDIVASSTTATGGQFILRYGTGTNCATGTVSLFPSAASAVRFGYPGNAATPAVISLKTPLSVPSSNDLCVLAVATNTLSVQILGYVAP